MKPIKNVLLLAGVVSAIIGLWLVPNINKTKTARYVRVYEDTGSGPRPVDKALTMEQRQFLKEFIDADINDFAPGPELFSRATHFKEDESVLAGYETAPVMIRVALSEAAKKYEQELIETRSEEFEFEPEMFSRATHFMEEEILVVDLELDSALMPPMPEPGAAHTDAVAAEETRDLATEEFASAWEVLTRHSSALLTRPQLPAATITGGVPVSDSGPPRR